MTVCALDDVRRRREEIMALARQYRLRFGSIR